MKDKNFNHVLWVFSHPTPIRIPSYVVGGIMPADILGIKKCIFLNYHDVKKTIEKFSPKIIIVSKVFHSHVLNLLKYAKEKKIKIISIFDDWNFDSNSKTDNTTINMPIAKFSDEIVVKTDTAALVLKKNINRIAKVVPDMVRFRKEKICKKISYPFNAVWFGMNSNHDTLINELPKIDETGLKINLKIITNFITELKTYVDAQKIKNINIEYIQWDLDYNNKIINSDIVIIPYSEDKERLVKSSNRIIDSINLGRFVILSKVKQFSEFKDITYFGEIKDGFHWLKNNSDLAISKITEGQRYVDQFYSPKVITKKWEEIILNLI